MSQEKIFELARKGSLQAIETLINSSLESKSITARVSSNNSCLLVLLESATIPPQDSLIRFLKTSISNLELKNVSQIMVQGRAAGQSASAWRESWILGHPKIQSLNSELSVKSKPVVMCQKPSKSIVVVTNSKPRLTILESLFKFTRTRRGERILLTAGTFLLTSTFWFGVEGISNSSNETVTTSGSPTPTVLAEDTPSTTSSRSEQTIQVTLNEDMQVESFMQAYLEEIVQGEDGSSFFCQQEDVSTFFAPRDFEILQAEMYDTGGQATVRLDSSNKGGMPITNHWKFYIDRGEPQYAALIGDVGEYGICISMILEND